MTAIGCGRRRTSTAMITAHTSATIRLSQDTTINQSGKSWTDGVVMPPYCQPACPGVRTNRDGSRQPDRPGQGAQRRPEAPRGAEHRAQHRAEHRENDVPTLHNGALGGTRTHTERILSPPPLPFGLRGPAAGVAAPHSAAVMHPSASE